MSRSVTEAVTGRRSKWIVLALWIVVLVGGATLAGKLTGVQDNDAESWLPGNAESTKAFSESAAFTSTTAIPAVVVYERSGGLTDADRAKAEADAEEFAGFPELDGQIAGPFPSDDGEALQTILPLSIGDDWVRSIQLAEDIQQQIGGGPDGLDAVVAGPLATTADQADAFEGIDSTLLLVTISVVVVILLITYRSPVLWVLPLVSAAAALMVAEGVVYLLARYAGLTVNAQSQSILTVLVLGASTDYALLLVARYREELRRHEDRHQAMSLAIRRAGPAIVASAGTVVLGMLCLLAAEMNSTQGLGPVLAIGVAVGMLAMLTLFPALLVLMGRWIFWPVRPQYGSAEPTTRGVWAKVGRAIAPRPRLVWVGTALVLAALSIGWTRLDADGLTTAQGFTDEPASTRAEQVVAEHFAVGSGSPAVILTNSGTADRVVDAIAGTEGVEAESVTMLAERNGRSYVEATLTHAAYSDEAAQTVERLRGNVADIDGADALVGGMDAVNLDIQNASTRDNWVVIPLVLVVVLLILMALLRALVAPLVLIATVVLSYGAAVGVSALVFDGVFGFAGADSSFPLFVFVFLVALGVDYNIFLMSRVREEAQRHGTRRGALTGLAATGGVITSAGLVLAGTFSVFITMPLVFLVEIGFAVAFGVLLDTLIVRAVLVTALTLDIGPRMWWPSQLSRSPGAPSDASSDGQFSPAPVLTPAAAHGLDGDRRASEAPVAT